MIVEYVCSIVDDDVRIFKKIDSGEFYRAVVMEIEFGMENDFIRPL